MRNTTQKVKRLMGTKRVSLVTDPAYHLASLRHAPEMADVLWEVKRAFERGVAPEPLNRGGSATFFLKDCEHRPIAIFKGDYYRHELAAYRLDYHHFAGVPPTVLTTLEHAAWGGVQTGSCQYFVPGSVAAVQLDRSCYDTFSEACVRRIAALDIRIMNEDRHSSNLLAVDENKILIPIDHGYILPHDPSNVHIAWLTWAQSKTPFTDTELAYISQLDPEKDRSLLLEELGLEEERAESLFIATILLKLGALRGLTAADMGNILSRKQLGLLRKDAAPSRFENLMRSIAEKRTASWTHFSRLVYAEVERTLDGYEKATP